MRICLQRVRTASVEVNSEKIAHINQGLLLLVGITHDETEEDLQYLVDKCVNLRIFEDDSGKMNISALDRKAEVLAISQFTLYANTLRGRRPSFTDAAPADISSKIFDDFVDLLRRTGLLVKTGKFGAHMQVSLVNDGPVTIILDSRNRS